MAEDWGDFLKQHIKVRAEEWANFRWNLLCGYIEKCCESPIEQQLLAALFGAFDYTEPQAEHRFQGYCGKSIPLDEAMDFAAFWAERSFADFGDFLVAIFPQVEIGRYRADFLLVAKTQWAPEAGGLKTETLRLVIECDGHNHHDLTKEQARRDRKRDRWMQANGFSILRFAGTEIVRDPHACADEVVNFVDGWQAQFNG